VTGSGQPLTVASIEFCRESPADSPANGDDLRGGTGSALRLTRLIDLIGTLPRPAASPHILRAGWGTGWLTFASRDDRAGFHVFDRTP
jgi:hypothetical protein